MTRQIPNNVFFAEAERILAEGGSVTMRVRGDSMRPLLRDGIDCVTIRRHTQDDIRKGAVMLFRHNGAYVMHRIRSVDGGRITFAGDGNIRTEEHAGRGDITAVMTSVTRPGGRTVHCTDRRWRAASGTWLALPAAARRCILGFLRLINK